MLDYLSIQNSTENPTFVTIIFTILLSFVLSSLIAFTYEKTTRQVVVPTDFLQTVVLVGIIAAMVMQAIGDSLARGLGMLGALAIIRFRTTLRIPRNMVFVFASLAAGISCGVYGYVIGITGTLGFCIACFILKYSPMNPESRLMGILKFEMPLTVGVKSVEEILNQYCQKFGCIGHKTTVHKEPKKVIILERAEEAITPKTKEVAPIAPEKFRSYEYHVKLKTQEEEQELEEKLSTLDAIQAVRLNFVPISENV